LGLEEINVTMNRTPKRRGRPAVLMFAVKGFGGSNKKVSVLQQITQPLTEMLGASPDLEQPRS